MPAIDEAATGSAVLGEARRTMEVCNACRYCEGFCAVFPAMTLRREFSDGDLTYLANLCHGCNGCYYACQYAPPHEFGINVPQVLSELRQESYAEYAWPRPFARAFQTGGTVIGVAISVCVASVLLLAMLLQRHDILFSAQPVRSGEGFYRAIPANVMVWVASIVVLFALLAMGIGFLRFWRATGGRVADLMQPRPLLQALRDAATLRYLGGGGHGCNDIDGGFSMRRRWLHHAMAYGFLLCFGATSIGAVYDRVLAWPAPYAFMSLPVLLGTLGGAGLTCGTAGLLWLKIAADREPRARALLAGEAALLVLLLLVALSGSLLLALRATGAMGVALAIHLGVVLAFLATMPYGKFVHGLYRTGALIRHAMERPGA